MDKRRWEGDASGTGVTDGRARLPEIQPPCDALAQPGWIAEDPKTQLLPHRARACTAAASLWTLNEAAMGADGVLRVALTWTRAGSLRAAPRSLALVGEIAEATTHVRQTRAAGTREYRVGTDMLAGDGPFMGHDQRLTLRIDGPRGPVLLAGMAGGADR